MGQVWTNRTYRGWEVIVKDRGGIDPLNQNITIGIKKFINGQMYGNWKEITQEYLSAVKIPFKDFVQVTADELINEAEGEMMGTTGTTPSYTTGNTNIEELASTVVDIDYGTGGGWWPMGYTTGDTSGVRYDPAGKYGEYTGAVGFPPGVLGSFKGIDVHISTNKENEMGSIKQDMFVYRMMAVDNVTYEVLAEGVVFARSENSANIKFALDNKIDPDAIGDTLDFYITYKAQLREPLDESKVQKVQVVE